MTTDESPQHSGQIRVADVTIAQLSRGLYRSTATAFKELVSNAYDADATEVRIDTNYPEFDFISCADNGTGMPLTAFLRYFSNEGIGSCGKRMGDRDVTERHGRPIIGRLGIGMLAIGQLCHSFEIESHYEVNGQGEAYWAKILLLDENIPLVDETIRKRNGVDQPLDVGTWQYNPIPYDKEKQGFRILTSDVRKTYVREMKESIVKGQPEKMPFCLVDLRREFDGKAHKSVRKCRPYLETIWELSILCPLPYYDDLKNHPVRLSALHKAEFDTKDCKAALATIREKQEKLLAQDFRVVYDGMELRRLIQLPTEDDVIPKLYHVSLDEDVLGRRLRFSGYVFGQAASAIRPLELNGVQIRLRNVGIGGYDPTFLKYYEQIDTIRSRWVSGEIFVEDGLESALNIDRDSFNEHDEHYRRLQSVLHEKLDKVFGGLSAVAKSESEKHREDRGATLRRALQTSIAKQTGGKWHVQMRDAGKEDPVVSVNARARTFVLNVGAKAMKKKKANMLIQAIELAYYAALHSTADETERHAVFLDLIKRALADLV